MHSSGSFDYKVINKNIRNILEARSQLNNTVQLAMPFVKATTTIGGPAVPLLDGGIGFTLGLHAIEQDVKYEDIYSSQGSDMPLIGYTYVDGKTRRIYANNAADEIAAQIFDRRAGLFTNSDGFVRIPPPGITNLTIGRNKNGLLAHGQLTITIPSLAQLESLQKTFLIPGVGMVLEWGQQFAVPSLTTNVTGELPDISYAMFPWTKPDAAMELLTRLGKNNVGLQEILEKYAYASSGQYMWMFGRVANFSINTLADGGFQSVVKIVGPSEDSWAYSTKNTVVPAKDASTKYFCASETNSVYSYFSETVAGGLNLKSLLDDVRAGNKFSEWKDHVMFFDKGNKKGGEPKPDEKKPNTSENSFADLEDAYFMSWRFFVNVVLNDKSWGLKRIFASALDEETLKKIGLLLPYADGPQRNKPVATKAAIDDPMEAFTGYNKFLRSIDPSVMVIVNEEAANLAAANPQYKSPVLEQDFLETTADVTKFKSVGQYDTAAPAYNKVPKDRSFLSTGVWLNHKTVVECMISGDTIRRGISNLLDRMNTATLNYWQLTLDTSEPQQDQSAAYNYMVIDANVKETSENAVAKFIDDVHVFNKYVRVDNATGNLVGSELIECSIDLSLPKRLFSQIATMGLVQPEDLHNAGISSGSASDPTDYTAQKTAKISDPNDTLRELYAITILNPASDSAQGPDLTILPKNQRAATLAANGVCGKANAQTPAQTSGNANRAAGMPLDAYKDKSAKELEEEQKKAQEIAKSETCAKCEQCIPPAPPQVPIPANKIGADPYPGPPDFREKYKNGQLPVSALVGIERGGKDRYTYQGSGGWYLLHPQAAAQYQRMKQSATAQGIGWTVTSAYRDLDHQGSLGSSSTVAKAGSSPHGWGGALDISELYRAVGGSGNPATNAQVRENNRLYKWLATNGPSFGWYNPKRLADGAGVDECWHFEYWGFLPKPATAPTPSATTPSAVATPPAVARPPALPAMCNDPKMIAECAKCNRAKEVVAQTTSIIQENDKVKGLAEKALREFGGLNKLFRYVEIFPEYMVAQITDAADGNFANAFGASPGSLSIGGDLTMPGVNGFRVGELFWIDRLPAFYKMFGAFQILSIEDVIDVSGWKTKIHARFNYLGKSWKTAMAAKINAVRR